VEVGHPQALEAGVLGHPAQPRCGVAAAVPEHVVVIAPGPLVSRDRQDHQPALAGDAAQLDQGGDVVVDVLEHVEAGHQGGGT